MKNFCDNCGAQLRPNAKFCTSCGKKISDDSANSSPMPYDKTESTQEIDAERNSFAQDSPPQNSYQNENQGGWLYETFLRRDGRLNRWRYFKRSLLLGLIALLLDAILAGIIQIPIKAIFENFFTATIMAILEAIVTTPFILYLGYGLTIRRSHLLIVELIIGLRLLFVAG